MPTSRSRLRAYLQLMRLPAVFTAMADIFAGFLMTHRELAPWPKFAGLLGASSALYLAGMILNDLFDQAQDARERPQRPIPSGRVSPHAAILLATALIAVGLACAFAVSDSAVKIATALAVLILLYDAGLKRTPLGPIAMGGCRALNVMLGASALFSVWTRPQTLVACSLGIYVAGVTWFARQEARDSSRIGLAGGAAVLHAGLVGFAGIVLTWPWDGDRWVALASLTIIAAFLDIGILPALRDRQPRSVQAAVRRQLLAIILLDATLIYFKTGSVALAAATALLVIPAATLGRWIMIT